MDTLFATVLKLCCTVHYILPVQCSTGTVSLNVCFLWANSPFLRGFPHYFVNPTTAQDINDNWIKILKTYMNFSYRIFQIGIQI